MLFEVRVGSGNNVDLLQLNVLTIKSVLSVTKLNNISERGSNRPIIFCHHILERFHKSALNVSGFCGLDGSINQTLSTSHCMEKELRWREPSKIRVFYKTTTFRAVIIFCVMWQCLVLESKGYSLSFH